MTATRSYDVTVSLQSTKERHYKLQINDNFHKTMLQTCLELNKTTSADNISSTSPPHVVLTTIFQVKHNQLFVPPQFSFFISSKTVNPFGTCQYYWKQPLPHIDSGNFPDQPWLASCSYDFPFPSHAKLCTLSGPVNASKVLDTI